MQLAGVVENSKNFSDFGTIWCPTNLPQSNRNFFFKKKKNLLWNQKITEFENT